MKKSILLVLTVVLIGCNGSSKENVKVVDDTALSDSENYNPGLEGFLYYGRSYRGEIKSQKLDLATGEQTDFAWVDAGQISTLDHASRQIVVAETDLSKSDSSVDVITFDEVFNEVGRFNIANAKNPRLLSVSPDGSIIALVYSSGEYRGSGAWLKLMDRNGQILWSKDEPGSRMFTSPDRKINSFKKIEWFPDGSGFYLAQQYKITRFDFTAGMIETDIFETNSMRIVGLALDPSGTRFALTMNPEGSRRKRDNHVYTMNIDGSDLLQLTDSRYGEWRALWSPDGEKLIVFLGEFISGTQSCEDIPFVVSPGVERVSLNFNRPYSSDAYPLYVEGGKYYVCDVGKTFFSPDWEFH